jgi:RimJ/RimL family protein N-acetyltransferase
MTSNSRPDEELQNTPTISVRPVQPDDAPFLLELYASTRAEELALVPWTTEQRRIFVSAQFAAQQDHYQKQYPEATHEIILANEQPIGQLHVARLKDEIRIIDFTVTRDRRNTGVGSFQLRRLLNEAEMAGKVVRIYVEDFNPSLRLFERMGFKPIANEGMNLLMEWAANGKATDE